MTAFTSTPHFTDSSPNQNTCTWILVSKGTKAKVPLRDGPEGAEASQAFCKHLSRRPVPSCTYTYLGTWGCHSGSLDTSQSQVVEELHLKPEATSEGHSVTMLQATGKQMNRWSQQDGKCSWIPTGRGSTWSRQRVEETDAWLRVQAPPGNRSLVILTFRPTILSSFSLA